MIVIDLGCAPHGEDSIQKLIDRFKPDVLYGFDPHPDVESMNGFVTKGTDVRLARKAAWTYDGTIGFQSAGLRSQVRDRSDWDAVPCFDLARWLQDLPDDVIVLKMDIEGAEKPVLEHLLNTGADHVIDLLLIEWHGHRDFVEPFDSEELENRFHCLIESWDA